MICLSCGKTWSVGETIPCVCHGKSYAEKMQKEQNSVKEFFDKWRLGL